MANNIITSSGVNTSEAPPGGTAVNNGNAGANIDISGTTLIPYGSNAYNTATPVTLTRVIYAWYDGHGSCDDTISLNIYITACPDIDGDNDALPDYLELNNPVALQDHESDGVPNWNDADGDGLDNRFDNNNSTAYDFG